MKHRAEFYNLLGISRGSPHFDPSAWNALELKYEDAVRADDAVTTSRLIEIARIIRREQSLFRTVRELMDSGNDLSGYDVAKCCYLELSDPHGKESAPAVIARTGLLVACRERSTIKLVQQLLPKRGHHIFCQTFIVRRSEGYGFRVESETFFDELRAEIVGPDEIKKLVELFGSPFAWANRAS